MKVEYVLKMKITGQVYVPESIRNNTIAIEDAVISWQVNEKKLESSSNQVESIRGVESISITFSGLPINLTPIGTIDPIPRVPGWSEKVSRIARYIANRVLMAANKDAIDVNYSDSPRAYPETPEEEMMFKKAFLSVTVNISVRASFSPATWFEPFFDRYSEGFKHEEAFSFYADGLRVNHAFSKCILFYKVVEYFFPPKKGQIQGISDYVSKFDNSYTPSKIENLKRLRHKAAHVKAQNIEDGSTIEDLRKLAKTLLDNPPAS